MAASRILIENATVQKVGSNLALSVEVIGTKDYFTREGDIQPLVTCTIIIS